MNPTDYLQAAEIALARLPQAIVPLLMLVLTGAFAAFLHFLLFRVALRFAGSETGLMGSLLRRARRPLGLAMILAALAIVVPRLHLPFGLERGIGHMILILLIVFLGWTAGEPLHRPLHPPAPF